MAKQTTMEREPVSAPSAMPHCRGVGPALAAIGISVSLLNGSTAGAMAQRQQARGFSVARPRLVMQGQPLSPVTSLALSPNGDTLAVGGQDGTVRLWDVRIGELRQTLTGHQHSVTSVAFSSDAGLLASGSWDTTVRLWDAQTGQLQRTLTGHRGWVYSVAFSPTSQTLASSGEDGTIRIWDARTGELRQTLTGHASGVTEVAFSPDGRVLASVSGDRTAKLWDGQTGKLRRTLRHTVPVLSVAFSPDSGTVATGGIAGLSGEAILWDTRTGRRRRKLTGGNMVIASLAFSPVSTTLAGGSDRSVILWETRTGAVKATLTGHSNWVPSVAFFADGRKLVTGSLDGTVKVWDVESGRLLLTLLTLRSSGDGGAPADWIAFSPEGDYHSSAGARQFIRWAVGPRLLPVEAYEGVFRRPDRVQEALRSRAP